MQKVQGNILFQGLSQPLVCFSELLVCKIYIRTKIQLWASESSKLQVTAQCSRCRINSNLKNANYNLCMEQTL